MYEGGVAQLRDNGEEAEIPYKVGAKEAMSAPLRVRSRVLCLNEETLSEPTGLEGVSSLYLAP